MAAWAADCAERVLGLFEAKAPGDGRPRDAIARTRAFARGELGAAGEIRRRFVGGGAAREVSDPAAAAAAKAAGQAASVAHMGAHALGAAAYAAKAAGLAAPNRPDAVAEEIRWQLDHMSPATRAALRQLPPVRENRSGPLGPGLLASGLLGTIIRELQGGLADGARRSVVLVTGMSGSGKSTALAALKSRGHRVVDTDDPGWIVAVHTDGGAEPLWDIDQVTALIDGHRTGWLFIAGCVANQGVVYDRFDAVVLLSAPVDVILDRVADRANPFGSTADDRSKIAADLEAFEPVLRARADHEIVTTAPVADVVAALEQVAAGAGRRDPRPSRHAHRP